MAHSGQLLALGGRDVDALLDPVTCIDAVEQGFRDQDEGAPPSGVLGMHAAGGGFHIKAAASAGWKFFVAKINANFPGNPDRYGLPTIQGIVVLFDGVRGIPLAILDSVRITALRTAAASAVAARHLARPDASRLFVAGCGTQARPHIDAIGAVRRLGRIALFDARPDRAQALQRQCVADGLPAKVVLDLAAAREADLVVTCTPSHTPFLDARHVAPGAFVAAVGADNEHKQEIDPCLMAAARVVVDSRAQCIAMGDTRGAIAAGTMTPSDIYGDLAEIVTGRRPGRSSESDVIIFDSTGVALEDVAAAAAVYQRALREKRGKALER